MSVDEDHVEETRLDESCELSDTTPSNGGKNKSLLSGLGSSVSSRQSRSTGRHLKARNEKVVGLGLAALGSDLDVFKSNLSFSAHRDRKAATDKLEQQETDMVAEEKNARNQVEDRPLVLEFMNMIASLKVFLYYLITLNTVVSVSLSVGLTVLWYVRYKESEEFVGGGVDWVLLGFAVVTPISVSIGISFRRREYALLHIAKARSFAYQIYMAHATWGWGKNNEGRSNAGIDSLKHSDLALHELIGMGDELCRFLTLPTSTQTRHQLTHRGREEAIRTIEVAYKLFESICTKRMTRLSNLCEVLKGGGITSSESARIRQFERFLGECFEQLRMIKMYRTPQALRAFGRLFTMFLPAFYAPSFAQLAFDLNSLPLGILFAVIAPLALCALFESVDVLEDPFVAFITLDGINIREEFMVLHWKQLMTARETIFPRAPPYSKDDEEISSPDENDAKGFRGRFRRGSENKFAGRRTSCKDNLIFSGDRRSSIRHMASKRDSLVGEK